MARAFPVSDPQDINQDPQNGDWQALRGELVALLDQVEGQYVRTAPQAPGFDALANRMRDLRLQVGDGGADNRHREALRSVKRQVDRFSERDEAAMLPEGSRDILQSAIQEIRARQGAVAPSRHSPAHLDALTQAMSGVNGRIEQIEIELKQQRGTSINVKEIADQVSQITHVVELLAGAVGETGQVKRLEGQIAGLAQLISEGHRVDLTHLTQRLDDVSETMERLSALVSESGQISPLKSQIANLAEIVAQGPQVDLSYLTRRLDEVSATVERLADLQIQQVQQLVREGKDAPKREQDIKDGLSAIESSVRNIYDRIDTIERTVAMPQADFESLTDAMARFTAAMEANSGKPDALIPLVEALNARISEMAGKGSAVAGLKADVAELRDTVLESFEPRFAAIESRIEALGYRLKVEHPSDTGIAQLEAQVRQLVARMDQTGEQLTGLARLYTENDEHANFEELATLVAERTSEAFVRNAPAGPGISDEQLASLEARIARLFNEAGETRAPDDYNLVHDGIKRVDERLARLEKSLTQGHRPEADKPVEREAMAFGAPAPKAPVAPAAAADPWSKSPAMPAPSVSAPVGKSDEMPKNPSVDAPLKDRAFPDLGSVRAALEARVGSRPQHPGLAEHPADPVPYSDASPVTAGMLGGAAPRRAAEMPYDSAPPVFAAGSAEPPPRPMSTFDSRADDPFSADIAEAPVARSEAVAPPAPTVNRNTFIEAARRNTQRQAAISQPATNSLIGRAMARFQNANAEAAKPVEPAAPAAEKPVKTLKERFAKKPVEALVAVEPLAPVEDDSISVEAEPARVELEPKESFLTRHRRPILLGATLVAVSVLTLNLVSQRLAEHNATQGNATSTPTPAPQTPAPAAQPGQQGSIAPSSLPLGTGTTGNTVLPPAPRIIPMVDDTTTGSIDPSVAMNYTAPSETPPMPSMLSPVSLSSKAFVTTPPPAMPEPAASTSPVQVEMPPEAVGPVLLRQAAANGDARAQFEVAAIYTEGRVVPEDLKAAAAWYERAAAQGFAPAQYRLGNLYESGKGVAKDLEQARLWYQRAAEAGNRMSMHNLAALYAGGQLGKQEFASAAEWFEQAAMRGMTDSQFNLGMLYARGLGVTQNLGTSYKWFSLAAKRGDKDAAKARDDIARSLDAASVSKINGEVDNWKPISIDLAANFAPIGTWSKSFDPGQPIAEKDVVSKVQQALQRLGYDIGSPDGVAGAKTGEAIKAFEQATGMSQVGKINPRLLAVLGSQPV
ncbi:MAG TPA: peptidoglycan-binding protein [Arsenicitalea sp.]|jgi:localization factor PodJL|nr:peptidoglycan-binding protein [Arsenicitalea sp.]